MYKVLKAKGNNSNIVVENADTKANVNIGRINIEILKILEDAGHKIDEDGLTLIDEWNLYVDPDTASKLTRMALRMKKPVRSKEPAEQPKKNNKQIDAMDVLLGLVNYN